MFAFFNNHRQGQAARNAEMFEAMLATRFPPAVVRAAPASAAEPERGRAKPAEPRAPRLFEQEGR